jgi:nucleotide-binding universal stress UspA family protein
VSNLFDRILVAIDDSEPAKSALALGARLAREHDGELIICNVLNWLPTIAELESTGAVVDPKPTIDALTRQAEALLEEAARDVLRRLGVVARRQFVEGDPAKGILSAAGKLRCSVIVMGTHARGGLGRLFIGSTTDAVLRGSAIPVLTVRPETIVADPARSCFERIVVGADDSEPARAAIETIIGQAAADDCHVLFCSVVDIDTVVGSRGYYDTSIHAGLYDDAQRVVDGAVVEARAADVAAEGRIAEGNASRALIAVAKRESADLIVTGSHGRRGVRRVFVGSVAETIVRTSPVPVLVVRTAARVPAAAVRAKRQTSAAL